MPIEGTVLVLDFMVKGPYVESPVLGEYVEFRGHG